MSDDPERKQTSKPIQICRKMLVKWCEAPTGHECPYDRGKFAEALIKEVEGGNVIVFNDEQERYCEFD